MGKGILIIANLFPLLGAFYWNWQTYDIMLLYWIETGVIGLFAGLKIPVASWSFLHDLAQWTEKDLQNPLIQERKARSSLLGHHNRSWLQKNPKMVIISTITTSLVLGVCIGTLLMPFMAAMLILIQAVFLYQTSLSDAFSSPFPEVKTIISQLIPISGAIAMLCISYAFEYLTRFLVLQEYKTQGINRVLLAPLTRIVILQLTTFSCALLFWVFYREMLGLVILVLIKTFADLLFFQFLSYPIHQEPRSQTLTRASK
ncbi:MAG: DUF6498-containing protein [bacterium]|nr:DUF6498-containing protein [bacterium]